MLKCTLCLYAILFSIVFEYLIKELQTHLYYSLDIPYDLNTLDICVQKLSDYLQSIKTLSTVSIITITVTVSTMCSILSLFL